MLLSYILFIINSTLHHLKTAALKLSVGETDIQLMPQSKDAIGSLATSICRIDESNKELTTAAQEIGNGNFNVKVMLRSEKDLLGTAIVKMQARLLDYTTDLKRLKDEFEKLADFMPQIVWTTDGFGRINYFNQKWFQITGVKEAYNEQICIQVIHPDDAGYTLSAWYRSVETGAPFEKEYRIMDVQNNEYRWFLARAVSVVNNKNEIVKWFGTATDIHDQKMQTEKLEDLVAERTLELKRSNEDLQQFAHVASHDLKEPLRKISTFSDRLNLEFGALIPDKGRTYLEKIRSSSVRMTEMIDSILNYSVVNATGPAAETVDLNRIVERITNDLELVILQKDAVINYHGLPALKGTPTLLYQLFYNLISNALKFSKTGVPPTITISDRKVASLELTDAAEVKRAGCYHHITIEDNGIGFNTEYAGRMFNIFTRLNSRDKYEGTGLGLALCRKIVHRHGGAIYAEGNEGVGSSFHIVLPA